MRSRKVPSRLHRARTGSSAQSACAVRARARICGSAVGGVFSKYPSVSPVAGFIEGRVSTEMAVAAISGFYLKSRQARRLCGKSGQPRLHYGRLRSRVGARRLSWASKAEPAGKRIRWIGSPFLAYPFWKGYQLCDRCIAPCKNNFFPSASFAQEFLEILLRSPNVVHGLTIGATHTPCNRDWAAILVVAVITSGRLLRVRR